jgi:hypothetical protein
MRQLPQFGYCPSGIGFHSGSVESGETPAANRKPSFQKLGIEKELGPSSNLREAMPGRLSMDRAVLEPSVKQCQSGGQVQARPRIFRGEVPVRQPPPHG